MKKYIIDGSWSIGKTTYCNELKEQGWSYLPEPKHEDIGVQAEEKTTYYAMAHLKNLLLFSLETNNTVMERSIFSTIAFLYALDDDFWKILLKESQSLLNKNTEIFTFFREKEKDDILESLQINPDKRPHFHHKYLEGWKIIDKNIEHKMHFHTLKNDQYVSNIMQKYEYPILRL